MRPVLVALLLLLSAAPASAQETIYAGPPFMYFTPEVTIDAGGTVDFTNLDVIGHDVMATDPGPDGKPWFRSEIVSAGGSSPVAGVEKLGGGTYGFVCSIHPSMTGTLTVNGPPAPPPSAPPSSPPPPPPSDTTAPAVSLSIVDSKVSAVRKRKALRLKVQSSEPSTIGITVRAGKKTVASGTFSVADTATVAVKLSAAGRKALKKARRVKLTVSALASDAAGNRAGAGASRTLR